MRCLILLAIVALAKAAIPPAAVNQVRLSAEDKASLVQELEDAELARQIEDIVEGLDEEQLQKLEDILAKDLDASSELDMLMAELKELGMEAGDIEDLTDLAQMMEKFLSRVPGIEEKIGAESDYTLLDQIKLYLLGLPNDIGPLGFVALHSVLEADDEDIVDVQVGEFTPDKEIAPVDEYLQRKKILAAEKAAESAAAEEEVTAELIKDILNRKRRAAGNQ